MTRARRSVLVLGAGIQGISTALALRRHGHRVTVIDRMPDLMLRTSLRNEGKIHLGYVYANDPSFQTAALLLRAACEFAPLFDEWLESPLDWQALCSTPFVYLVMRDSMLAPDAIRAHYERLQECLKERIAAGESVNYLGQNLKHKRLWKPSGAATAAWFAPDHVVECIETVELALDRQKFRELLKAHLARFTEIQFRYGHSIREIERRADGFRVRGKTNDGSNWCEAADVVVNCLWDGRLALDQQLGIDPTRAFVMRLKYRLLATLPPALQDLPSMTLVLGRYGDIVKYPGAPTYVSWYPACLRGWSSTITPPAEWDAVCAGNPPSEIAASVQSETLAAFDQIIPGMNASEIHTIDGGVIYSWGETDIDDHASKLHTRHEIGFAHHDGYYTVDTGKFTCAPMFAEQIAKHVVGE